MHNSRWLSFLFIPLIFTGFSAQATPSSQLSSPSITISAHQDHWLKRGGSLVGETVVDLTNGPAAITVSTLDSSLIAISLTVQSGGTIFFNWTPHTCNIKKGSPCQITFTPDNQPFTSTVLVSGVRLRDNAATNIVTLTVLKTQVVP